MPITYKSKKVDFKYKKLSKQKNFILQKIKINLPQTFLKQIKKVVFVNVRISQNVYVFKFYIDFYDFNLHCRFQVELDSGTHIVQPEDQILEKKGLSKYTILNPKISH